MEELVREHEFVDDVCRWCGGREGKFAKMMTCVSRQVGAAQRSIPTSIFSDLGSIGDRMREIQAEELPAGRSIQKTNRTTVDQRGLPGITTNHSEISDGVRRS